MNNAKLVVTVIILCIVSPIMIGYAWPVDSTSETAWETGDPKDISNDAINAKLPVYVPYNDPFANNMNVFDIDQRFANIPVTPTDNPGPVWYASSLAGAESIHIDSDGFYEIPDLGTWKNWGNIDAVLIPFDTAWMDEIDMDDGGGVAQLVVYYPKTDKMYYRHLNSDDFWPVESHKLIFSANWGKEDTDQTLYYWYYYATAYGDLTDGMVVPSDGLWFNGYKNKGCNIIFNTMSGLSNFVEIIDPNGYVETEVSIWESSGTINLSLWRDGTFYDSASLGSISIYDKVLLTVDYDSATIALSGLRGLDAFNGDYNNAIRETIKLDWRDPVIFDTFEIVHSAGSGAAWYVADTLSAVAEIDGSRNFEMDLRDYTANGSCQLNIRNVTQHGDKLGLMINSTYKLGTISKGELTIAGVDETITVPVNNMLIGLIGNKVYLNGYLLFEASSITKVNIYFYDDWKMSLIYYPVTETSVTGYSWLPGGFGLDVNGFCMVGLITSALSGLAASLYGRRSGAKMVFVTFTSGIIAAVYLIILMGGL